MNVWKMISLALVVVLGLVIGGNVVQLARAEHQPHMEAALSALRTARDELKVAEHDKGGHRSEAIKLTDAAIQQVEHGIRWDDEHRERH